VPVVILFTVLAAVAGVGGASWVNARRARR
jgi:hypothetical protein